MGGPIWKKSVLSKVISKYSATPTKIPECIGPGIGKIIEEELEQSWGMQTIIYPYIIEWQ